MDWFYRIGRSLLLGQLPSLQLLEVSVAEAAVVGAALFASEQSPHIKRRLQKQGNDKLTFS